jgi:hypothetical protein
MTMLDRNAFKAAIGAPDEGFDGIVVTFPGAKGQSFKAGFYGGPNSSARRKMANFGDGTGILMVGDVGFMMNVR